jgi:hypothetical protein
MYYTFVCWAGVHVEFPYLMAMLRLCVGLWVCAVLCSCFFFLPVACPGIQSVLLVEGCVVGCILELFECLLDVFVALCEECGACMFMSSILGEQNGLLINFS